MRLKTPFFLCVQLVKFYSINSAINFSSQLKGICCKAWSSVCFLAPGHTFPGNISPFWCYVIETFLVLIVSGFFPRKCIRRVQWYLVPGGVTVTQSAHTILSEYGNPLHSFTAGSAVESDGLQQGKHRVNGFTFKTMLSCAQVLETFLFLLLNENLTSVTMRRLVCSSTHNKQQARRQGIFQALMEAVWQNK